MRAVTVIASVVIFLLAGVTGATNYTYPINATLGTWTLQDVATSGNGDAIDFNASVGSVVLYVSWSAGCSAGVLVVETAASASYAGTWAPLATVTWSAASKTDIVQIIAPVEALRVRISTPISGGTVTVTATGR